MAKELSFYKCSKTGLIVEVLEKGSATPFEGVECMELMEPKTADFKTEKHVPVVEVNGTKVNVKVGSTPHPMTEEHYIGFVVIVTEKTVQRVDLCHTGAPEANFVIAEDDKVVAAYEYCNLHGLWEIKLG